MIRKVDVKDLTNSEAPILYEFKSVQSVPPGQFNSQFLKDLSNPDVSSLNQIQWIFDGRKAPSDFTTNIETAIDNLPLTEELALKFTGQYNLSAFRTYLKSEIPNIFKLQ